MKLFKLLFVPMVITLIQSCGSDNQTQLTEIKDNAVEIDLTQSDYTFTVNQKSYLEMDEHGSVGAMSEVIIGDNSIIGISGDIFDYDNQDSEIEPGGDGGTRTYSFTALKKGSTTISAREYFRGDLQKEHVLNITVE